MAAIDGNEATARIAYMMSDVRWEPRWPACCRACHTLPQPYLHGGPLTTITASQHPSNSPPLNLHNFPTNPPLLPAFPHHPAPPRSFVYPITPSTPMGELSDQWAADGRTNIFGNVPQVGAR